MPSDIGPYRILRSLGRGTFAQTYEAEHTLLGLRACLKVGQRREDNPIFVEEARILWNLFHPSLPTLRDLFYNEAGCAVLAMRFVEGDSLDRVRPVDAATAVQVLGRLLRALRVVHFMGVVHNDIKPANIILEPDRHGVVLVDFGVSTVRPVSRSRAVGFTPAFVAPEVRSGSPPTPESDLFSLALSVLDALGGDVERRVLPEGVPEPLLELLVEMSRPDPAARPRWGRRNPLDRLERMLPRLSSL